MHQMRNLHKIQQANFVERDVPWTMGEGGFVLDVCFVTKKTSIFKHARLSRILAFPHYPLGKTFHGMIPPRFFDNKHKNSLQKYLIGDTSPGSLKKKNKQSLSTEGHSTLCFDLIFPLIVFGSINLTCNESFYFAKTRQHENQALKFEVLSCINKIN